MELVLFVLILIVSAVSADEGEKKKKSLSFMLLAFVYFKAGLLCTRKQCSCCHTWRWNLMTVFQMNREMKVSCILDFRVVLWSVFAKFCHFVDELRPLCWVGLASSCLAMKAPIGAKIYSFSICFVLLPLFSLSTT